MEPSAVRVLLPGNVRHNSGGNAYNAALLRALAELGVATESRNVDGDWPVGSPADRQRFGRLLAESDGAQLTLVDGLVASGAPAELEAAAAAGSPAWILLHMPLADHHELERRALDAAAGVICSSSSAAADLRARHGLGSTGGVKEGTTIGVALPGTEAAVAAPGSRPPHLAMVAALLPNKSQLLLLRALAGLTDLGWTASLVGADTADPEYARLLRDESERLGLADRVRIPGELRGAALEAEWARTDLSLLISRAETFGMAVTESLARGIPAIIRQGTGALEALTAGTPGAEAPGSGALGANGSFSSGTGATQLPGAAVALSDAPEPLAELLRSWLTDPDLRARWRAAALAARDNLPGWEATARAVLALLGAGGSAHGPGTGKPGSPGR